MKNLLILLCFLLSITACRRPGAPDARICPSKEIYKTTDTIKMVNCSLRSNKQRWELPDGSQSSDQSVYYVPPGAGSYKFTIYVSDEDFVNEYAATYFATVQ